MWQVIFSAVLKILRIAKKNPQDLQSVSTITHLQPGMLGLQCYTIILIAPFRLPIPSEFFNILYLLWLHHQISFPTTSETLALFPVYFTSITGDLRKARMNGRGDTIIMKVLFPGWVLFIALWMCWPGDFPKCGKHDCIICSSGGTLHSSLN